jgi:hypothetical protein
MVGITESMLVAFEDLTANMCDARAERTAGMPVSVVSLPPERRRHKHVRYGYAMKMGEQFVPMA